MAPTLQPYKDGYFLWHYVPSVALSVIFAILFVVATLGNSWRMFRARAWFCSALVIGGLFEVIGYITRGLCAYHTDSLSLFIIETLFLLLPPILFAATLYTVYGRVVRAVPGGAELSLLSARRTTIIFVSGDVVTLLVQAQGGSMQTKASQAVTGARIVVAGLILQLLMFAAFIILCGHFNLRLRARHNNHHYGTAPAGSSFLGRHNDMLELSDRDPSKAAYGSTGNYDAGATADATATTRPIRWQACLNMLYAASLAILVRNLYRMVEFVTLINSSKSYLNGHEWPVYVFDGALMLVVMGCFAVWHPSRLLGSSGEGKRAGQV